MLTGHNKTHKRRFMQGNIMPKTVLETRRNDQLGMVNCTNTAGRRELHLGT